MEKAIVLAVVSLLAAATVRAELPTMWTDPVSGIVLRPVEHASFVLQIGALKMAVDPTGKPESYTADSPVELILLTDIHPDHLDAGLLSRLKNDRTVVIGPAAVINKLGYGTVLTNGARTEVLGLVIEAIPAYNTTQGRLDFHPKGRGNGYVLTTPRGIRVYISGDTEDTSEMRALKDIDFALVCMNLPYTMTPEQAAAAVKEFKPRTAIPYHYRQMGGVSDIMSFRKSVEEAGSTKVVLLKWY